MENLISWAGMLFIVETLFIVIDVFGWLIMIDVSACGCANDSWAECLISSSHAEKIDGSLVG